MTRETLVLVGRSPVAPVAATHADRLRDRGIVDEVRVATYRSEPAHELRDPLSGVSGDRIYAVPMCFAHTHATLRDVPRALGRLPGGVRYCDPIGTSPLVTGAIHGAAGGESDADSLLLVALGNSSEDHAREAAAFHADRLRDEYAEVRTAFLLQSPAVECARYTLEADRAAVCPLFLADCEATTEEIPKRLEVARGGLDYAEPFGDDPAVTEAIRVAVERERVLAESGTASPGTDLVSNARAVATDGRGDT
ncbi:cobalamin biosynthesis protein CbiX [Halorubrum sp. CBA1125]|uniref:CbiX/SirB N-terminal domain-containing protein n=1 Tax=Halorubrum sp. CBA1125 TaxID=2668072 RepID=UPI0012E81279|nr:CbiX/SirB N-terminal domain-containing protein [Halorubrum sp. CBA1125]MUW13992.1 cobalamin biosynthesis protein CbiX [Halorubrum sp. CBA1125]